MSSFLSYSLMITQEYLQCTFLRKKIREILIMGDNYEEVREETQEAIV